jgi:hypothetical protein
MAWTLDDQVTIVVTFGNFFPLPPMGPAPPRSIAIWFQLTSARRDRADTALADWLREREALRACGSASEMLLAILQRI